LKGLKFKIKEFTLKNKNLILSFMLIPIAAVFLFSCSKKDEFEISLGQDTETRAAEIFDSMVEDSGGAGFLIYDINQKKVISSRNRKIPFIPASTSKVPTTIAALKVLGPDYRFKTTVGFTGSVKDGLLNGDLYLKGTGDPFLNAVHLMIMAGRVKFYGINKISGNFYFDESGLHSSEVIDSGMQNYEAYNQGVSALSLDFNAVYSWWDRNKSDKKSYINIVPSLPMFKADIIDKKKYDDFRYEYVPDRTVEKWIISQDTRSRGREKLPVKKPGLYTAMMLKKFASMQGVELPEPQPKTVPGSLKIIQEHHGQPVIEIADMILSYSNNLMSELLLLETAGKLSGKVLDFENSASVVSDYLKSRIKGVDWNGFKIVNGSGLTNANRITPEQLAAFFIYADGIDLKGRNYFSLLPASGWEGSLSKRLYEEDAAFRVWAKTGAVNYAASLAGYMFTKSGRKLIFSVMLTDFPERKKYDSFSPAEKEEPEVSKKAYSWSEKNKNLIDRVVLQWIKEL
jgi:D-alanyl-D-alanine carboxypeptidase/D-alanyl-D-alanine-endopeptidase (penicillin-binding protein 4)